MCDMCQMLNIWDIAFGIYPTPNTKNRVLADVVYVV